MIYIKKQKLGNFRVFKWLITNSYFLDNADHIVPISVITAPTIS